jgi:hypothetical protein
MNISAAPTYIPAYQPQAKRLGLLHGSISTAMFAVLLVFLSVYVSQIDPKIGLLITSACILIGNKRLLAPHIWPLLALIGYGAALNFVFPGPKPDAGVLLEHALFLVNCILLASIVLGGQPVSRQYMFMLGVLLISVIGAVGDWRGRDMTALLPFELPDDPYLNVLFTEGGGVLRIRGFFSEASVLASVSIGYATMVVIGSLVLLRLRACRTTAWIALLGALCGGGIIFVITVTKSGIVMIAASCIGFIAVLLCTRSPKYRTFAFASLVALVGGGAIFLALGPPTLTDYLRGELWAAVNPSDAAHDLDGNHSGTLTRYKCWLLAFQAVRLHPMGVGAYGLGTVLEQTGEAGLSREMRHFFSHDIFGLKNALANLLAQDGLVGLGILLYWMWIAFLRPIRHYLAEGSAPSILIAGVYGASALASWFFLFSCELYPSFSFLIILKFHADAIAQACTRESGNGLQSVELIG